MAVSDAELIAIARNVDPTLKGDARVFAGRTALKAAGHRLGPQVDARLRMAAVLALNEGLAPSFVDSKDLAILAMVSGGERRLSKVVDLGKLKEWVGIGWVGEEDATEVEMGKYPMVWHPAFGARATPQADDEPEAPRP